MNDTTITLQDLIGLEERLNGFIKDTVALSRAYKEFYSVREFAELTGLGKGAITYRCRNGLLQATQAAFRSSWMIDGSELLRFKEEAQFNN